MFLRCKVRRKDGKQHRYWSVVENTRVAGGRVVQRHVLYLGEINDTQELAWRRSIAVLEDGAAQPRTLSLFPEDRCEGLLADASIVRVKLSELQLRRPRQWGACWLALLLWRELQLDLFWCKRLGVSRKPSGTAPGAALCSRRPSTGDRMIDHQYDDRSNHRDHHAVYIEAGDPARAHRCKDEAPYDRPDNAEYDVEEEAFAGFVHDFAGDETRD